MRGNQSTSRTLNRLLVLNHLRRFGPTSRSDLASAIGLSSAAVTYVSAELLEERFIVESAATNGRRSTPLDLNYGGHLAVGVKLMETSLRATLTDLGTRVVDSVSVEVDARVPEDVARAVVDARDELIRRAAVPPSDRLLGIGLAMPGQHDAMNGVCLRCHRLGWRDVPIGPMIAERAGVSAWVDNDVNAFALAEHLFGKGKTASSLAVLSFGRGVGAAFIVDGALIRGHSGGAGEIGHINVVENGPVCECGRRGCLEAVSSYPAMLDAYIAAGGRDRPVDAPGLADLAAGGDRFAVRVLTEVGSRLGSAAAALVNLFDPEALVVGGEGMVFGPALLDALLGAFQEKSFQERTEIHLESWGDDAWTRGAAALAADSFFSFPRSRAETP